MISDADFMAKVLADGRWHSQAEILAASIAERGHGLTVHSRAATLRQRGLTVLNKVEHRSGRPVSFYRLGVVAAVSAPPLCVGTATSAPSSSPNLPLHDSDGEGDGALRLFQAVA